MEDAKVKNAVEATNQESDCVRIAARAEAVRRMMARRGCVDETATQNDKAKAGWLNERSVRVKTA